jgi:hypothetical protein
MHMRNVSTVLTAWYHTNCHCCRFDTGKTSSYGWAYKAPFQSTLSVAGETAAATAADIARLAYDLELQEVLYFQYSYACCRRKTLALLAYALE